MKSSITILAIESSCDDTSAAVLENEQVLSNLVANQNIHSQYGGVVPELASRAHQKNIVPVVDQALRQAQRDLQQIDAIAYTEGPGLLGSLLVGTSFTKGLAMGLGIPMIPVHHMKAHILAHFIDNNEYDRKPEFPFMCLTVSGGHTQIVLVNSPCQMKVIGETKDDAAGEAFDKIAKIIGLPYPGGPLIDQLAKEGDQYRFSFPKSRVKGYDFSFSGLKTSVLYFLRVEKEKDHDFIEKNKSDICASVQHTIVDTLLKKFEEAAQDYQVKDIAIAGGVSANSLLRERFKALKNKGFYPFIPSFEYCTDNAAMIGIAGYYEYMERRTSALNNLPKARWEI